MDKNIKNSKTLANGAIIGITMAGMFIAPSVNVMAADEDAGSIETGNNQVMTECSQIANREQTDSSVQSEATDTVTTDTVVQSDTPAPTNNNLRGTTGPVQEEPAASNGMNEINTSTEQTAVKPQSDLTVVSESEGTNESSEQADETSVDSSQNASQNVEMKPSEASEETNVTSDSSNTTSPTSQTESATNVTLNTTVADQDSVQTMDDTADSSGSTDSGIQSDIQSASKAAESTNATVSENALKNQASTIVSSLNNVSTADLSISTQGTTAMSQDDVMALYDKYLRIYHTEGSSSLFDLKKDEYNADGTLTQASRQEALDVINFMRELSGLSPVTENFEYDTYAQAGVDYLKNNNLDIDHNAADNSGNENAKEGLNGSDLAEGYSSTSLYDLILSWFSDDDAYNRGIIGHRAWLLDPGQKSIGLGVAVGSVKEAAVYVMGSDRLKSNLPATAFPASGSSPIEVLNEISESGSLPWSVNLGSQYKLTGDGTEVVTITADDGTKYTYTKINKTQASEKLNAYNISTVNYSTYNVVINPYDLYQKYGCSFGNYNGLKGHSFTITISGLQDANGNPATYQSKVSYFSAMDKIQVIEKNQTEAKKATTAINGLPDESKLSWEDASEVAKVKAVYDALTDDQKKMLDPTLIAKLNAYESKMDQLTKQHATDLNAAQTVSNAVKALNSTITLNDESFVVAARKAYDTLTTEQKKYVSSEDYIKLVNAESAITSLKAEQSANEKAARSVSDAISALPSAVSLEDISDVRAARKAYDALTDAQKSMVSAADLSKLTGAEAKISQLEAVKADQDKADAVTVSINQLPGSITLSDEHAIQSARAAYDALTDAQKADVGVDTLSKLTNAEKDIANLKLAEKTDEEKASTVSEKINGLSSTITLDDETAVTEAANLYDALTDAQKKKISQADKDKLQDAINTIGQLKAERKADQDAADVVAKAIDSIPQTVALTDEAAINQVQADYDALSDAQKALIDPSTISRLADAESKIAGLEAAKTDQEKADTVITAINGLPETIALSDEQAVQNARAAYDALTDAQKADVGNDVLAKLARTEKAIAGIKQADASDNEKAKSVSDTIDGLPKKVTLDDEDAVSAASSAYDALTDAQKAKISLVERNKLQNAIHTISELKAEKKANEDAAGMVVKQIVDLPANITLDDEHDIVKAAEAYNKLTDAQKKLVSSETLEKLDAANKTLAALKLDKIDKDAAQGVQTKIEALPSVDELTLTDKDALAKTIDAFNALSDTQKKYVGIQDQELLKKLEAQIKVLEQQKADQQEADQVSMLIRAMKKADGLTLIDRNCVYNIEATYNALSDSAKHWVDNELVEKLRADVAMMERLEKNELNHPNQIRETGTIKQSDYYSGQNGEILSELVSQTDKDGVSEKVSGINDESGSDNPDTAVDNSNEEGIFATAISLVGIGLSFLLKRKKEK